MYTLFLQRMPGYANAPDSSAKESQKMAGCEVFALAFGFLGVTNRVGPSIISNSYWRQHCFSCYLARNGARANIHYQKLILEIALFFLLPFQEWNSSEVRYTNPFSSEVAFGDY